MVKSVNLNTCSRGSRFSACTRSTNSFFPCSYALGVQRRYSRYLHVYANNSVWRGNSGRRRGQFAIDPGANRTSFIRKADREKSRLQSRLRFSSRCSCTAFSLSFSRINLALFYQIVDARPLSRSFDCPISFGAFAIENLT